jgi:hypothetical protein
VFLLPPPTPASYSPSVKRGSGSFRKKDLSRLLITLRSCQRWGSTSMSAHREATPRCRCLNPYTSKSATGQVSTPVQSLDLAQPFSAPASLWDPNTCPSQKVPGASIGPGTVEDRSEQEPPPMSLSSAPPLDLQVRLLPESSSDSPPYPKSKRSWYNIRMPGSSMSQALCINYFLCWTSPPLPFT